MHSPSSNHLEHYYDSSNESDATSTQDSSKLQDKRVITAATFQIKITPLLVLDIVHEQMQDQSFLGTKRTLTQTCYNL